MRPLARKPDLESLEAEGEGHSRSREEPPSWDELSGVVSQRHLIEVSRSGLLVCCPISPRHTPLRG